MALLPCLAVTLLIAAVLPAAAFGAEVSRGSDGIITLQDFADANDEIAATVNADGEHVFTSSPNGLDGDGADCLPDGLTATVTCVAGSSIAATLAGGDDSFTDNGLPVPVAVDLGAGVDSFTANGVSTPLSIAGGLGVDTITGGAGGDVLAGGDGNDTLTGGPGVDDYFGEAGDDTIVARDGVAERISCGAGNDVANNDFVDIIAECERGIDGDGDGFSSSVDCNDASAAIFPGAREVFENGIDENCNGRDDVNLDRDADGFPRPVDCDDGNAGIRPGAREVRGNRVDENCDQRAAPFAQLATVVSNRWVVAPGFTRLIGLVVRNAPKGARITLRCTGRGCPIKRARRRTVRRNLKKVVLHRGFRRARLRPGARLRLTIKARETIGRTYTYEVERGALPQSRIVCRPPGRRRRAC
jgi:Putative metal-binding motif/RTX calcium-binding nonapeptide repeat (4 copies)